MNKFASLFLKIHIHPLLWIVIAFAVVTAHFIELSLLLLIIFVHEMGHAGAAAFFSWRIKKISLLPFGGMAEMDEHGNRPLREEAIVVLAGPLQHLWLMAAAAGLYELSILSAYWYDLFIQYNAMILIFNLLPVWPLDGGKLVFLLLSLNRSFNEAHRLTLLISFVGVFLFALVTLVTMPLTLNIWIIIGFLMFSLYFEWKQRRFVFMRFLLERYYGKQADFQALRPIKVNEEDLIIHVLSRFHRGCKHPIIVEKAGSKKSSLDENELLHAYFAEKQLTAKISDLLYTY